MRLNVSSDLKCPGCKLGNKISFRRPGFMEKSIFTVECQNCESTIMYKAHSAKGDECQFSAKITKPGETLLLLTKEEQEMNAKPELEATP